MDTFQWPDRPFQQLQNVSPQTFSWSQHHHFLLIYLLTKTWYWNQLLRNANSIKVLKLVTSFFLSLVILRNCQLAFQPPHQNNQGLSEFYFSLYLSSASSLCYINSKTLTNCSPVTSPCKSVALLPCLTTQNSASSLHKEREQCWVLGNCSLLSGLRQPN